MKSHFGRCREWGKSSIEAIKELGDQELNLIIAEAEAVWPDLAKRERT